MGVHPIILDIKDEAAEKAMWSRFMWIIMANPDKKSSRRVHVAEQTTDRGVFCVECEHFVKHSETWGWMGHRCANTDILSFEFMSLGKVAGAEASLLWLKSHARREMLFMNLWKKMSSNVISLFSHGLVNDSFIAALHSLRLLESRLPFSKGYSITVPRSPTPSAARPNTQIVPHFWITVADSEQILESVQNWFNFLLEKGMLYEDPFSLFLATAIRMGEQTHGEEDDGCYDCMRCEASVAGGFLSVSSVHMCKATAATVTFKAVGAGGPFIFARAWETLLCLKDHITGNLAVRQLWKVVTLHCFDLYDNGMIPAERMQQLREAKLLCEEMLSSENVEKIRQYHESRSPPSWKIRRKTYQHSAPQ